MQVPPSRYTPWTGTPPGRYTPWAGTPPRQDTPPPSRYTPQVGTPPGRYTPRQCMLGYGQQAGGTHPTGMHSCRILMFLSALNSNYSFTDKYIETGSFIAYNLVMNSKKQTYLLYLDQSVHEAVFQKN